MPNFIHRDAEEWGINATQTSTQTYLLFKSKQCCCFATNINNSGTLCRTQHAGFEVQRAQRCQTFPNMMRLLLPLKLGGVSPNLMGSSPLRLLERSKQFKVAARRAPNPNRTTVSPPPSAVAILSRRHAAAGLSHSAARRGKAVCSPHKFGER